MASSNNHPRARLLGDVIDLAVPLTCGGCGRPGVRWCARCDRCLTDAPRLLTPRVELPVAAWAVGSYHGPLRAAVLAVKEHGRRDLAEELGAGVATAVTALARWGEVPADRPGIALVPAPTRRVSARRRGGDPVTIIAQRAAARLGRRARVVPLLVTGHFVRDSSGLAAGARSANLAGSIILARRPTEAIANGRVVTVLLDDVLTTGATAAASIRVLRHAGLDVDVVLVVAGA